MLGKGKGSGYLLSDVEAALIRVNPSPTAVVTCLCDPRLTIYSSTPRFRCNLACPFCFNRSLPQMADMPFPDFHRMTHKLHAIGVRTIDIIGGEPTIHPDLQMMIKTARHKGLAVNISSNGTNLIQLEAIREKYPQVSIGVSVNDRRMSLSLEEFIR